MGCAGRSVPPGRRPPRERGRHLGRGPTARPRRRRPEGRSLRPAKLWNDTTSAPQAAALRSRLGDTQWARRCGLVPIASFTITKLAWLAQHEPASFASFASIDRVMLPHDESDRHRRPSPPRRMRFPTTPIESVAGSLGSPTPPAAGRHGARGAVTSTESALLTCPTPTRSDLARAAFSGVVNGCSAVWTRFAPRGWTWTVPFDSSAAAPGPRRTARSRQICGGRPSRCTTGRSRWRPAPACRRPPCTPGPRRRTPRPPGISTREPGGRADPRRRQRRPAGRVPGCGG